VLLVLRNKDMTRNTLGEACNNQRVFPFNPIITHLDKVLD